MRAVVCRAEIPPGTPYAKWWINSAGRAAVPDFLKTLQRAGAGQ